MPTDLLELVATLFIDTDPFRTGLDAAGDMLESFGRVVIDFAEDTLRTGLAFDKAMAGVFAVTQTTDKATKSMLENAAIAEAERSAFTTAEVAMAEYYEGLAGYNAQEIADGLHAIVVAAEASGESLPLVADIITDVNRAFKGQASEQEHVADVLAATATSTNTTIGKLGQSFKHVAPVAGALGYEIEDVAILFGVMADNGTKASQAGTSLRNILTRLGTNAGATNKDLGALEILTDALGVSFYDASGKVRPLVTVIEEARESWQGLNDVEKDSVLDAFVQLEVGGKDADEVMKTLGKDVKWAKEALAEYNKTRDSAKEKEYETSIRNVAASYSTLFDLLGMKVDPANDNLQTLYTSMVQAKAKLGELSDEERIYFAKQIGSLRGMTPWLELMEAETEHWDNVKTAIMNATGAAEEMRDIRMGSNLWGDVETFKAAFDGLKTRIYLDARDPLREVVQEGTEGLRRISIAVGEDGIIGGLKQLSIELKNIRTNETFQDFVTNLGAAVQEVMLMLPDLGIDLAASAASLGKDFGMGLMGGAIEALEGTKAGEMIESLMNNPKLANIANWIFGDLDTGNDTSKAIDEEYVIPLKLLPDPEDLGFVKDELTGVYVQAGEEGGKQMMDNVAAEVTKSVDGSVGGPLRNAMSVAGTEGGADMTANITNKVNSFAPDVSDILSSFIGNGGAIAGALFTTLFGNKLNTESWNMADFLANTLGGAGNKAGWDIASGIQSALNFSSFTVGITGVINNVVNKAKGLFGWNASAMSSGRIYTKPTVFGYYNNAYQVAGDAGPEAVVGVNSLQRMITSAVHNAGAGQEVVVPRNDSRQLTVILELDRQQLAKTMYRLNNEETQRVGVKLAKGVDY